MHGPQPPPSIEGTAPPHMAGMKQRGMVILPARKITNHAGQQLPPPDLRLPPHPSQPASQQRHSWLDLSQKRNFTPDRAGSPWSEQGQAAKPVQPLRIASPTRGFSYNKNFVPAQGWESHKLHPHT